VREVVRHATVRSEIRGLGLDHSEPIRAITRRSILPTNTSGQRLAPDRNAAGLFLLALVAAGCGDPGPSETSVLDLDTSSARATLASALSLEGGGEAAIVALRAPLADTDWVVRAQALAILGRLGDSAIEIVGPATSDPHPSVRFAAIEALHRISGSASVPWLMSALGDRAARIRIRSLRALADVGALTTADAARVVALLGDPDRKARRWAALVAIFMGARAVAALESSLGGDAEHRWRAAWALGQIGPPAASALPRLRELATDTHARVSTESQAAILAIELER